MLQWSLRNPRLITREHIAVYIINWIPKVHRRLTISRRNILHWEISASNYPLDKIEQAEEHNA